MSVSSKKVKNETFTEYRSFRALYNSGTRIIRSYLRPLHANAANPKPNPPAGEQRPEEEYYCKFSNDHVLRAFLSYLGGGQLAGLERVDDRDTSLDLVVQRCEAFKKYYHSNAKEVEGLNVAEVDRAIFELKSKYLLL